MYRGRREVPLPVRIRDELGELFADAEFAVGFGKRGKPGWSPGRLALVTVLQRVENLTDRQAAEQVRLNLTWKYALGLALDDPGFDHTVLSEFRARVVEHGLQERVLDLLVAGLVERGLLASGGKQRTDSTHVVAAVRDLNRLELAGESVRAALEALTVADPEWVGTVLDVPEWSRRYGARIDTWRLPTSQTKKAELASRYGRDGFALLRAVFAAESPSWLRELPAVEVLRIVLLQNYTRHVASNGREVVKRRESATEDGDGLPPGSRRVTSPYDIDARWSAKRDMFWNGYKLHVSETCQAPAPDEEASGTRPRPPRPNVITNVATTDATVPDSKALERIHSSLERRGLVPDEHYLDSGYPSAELIVGSLKTWGIALITPVLLNHTPQAKAGQGFATDDFAVDWDTEQATCPAGKTSSTWNPVTQAGQEKIVISFKTADCRPCPSLDQCTTSTKHRRQISISPREMTEALRLSRVAQETKDWQEDYALRAGVEGTISQAAAVTGIRRARYRGRDKTHLDHVYSAVALNLIRLDAWWNGHPLDRTRTSHLARLELTLAA
jgi:transposase